MINILMEMMNQKYYVEKNAQPTDIKKSCHSFSFLQGVFEQGFSFVMFPSSHKWHRDNVMFHRSYGIRLILPNYCGVLFLDDLLHCGGRVRFNDDGSTCIDPRLFFYIQQIGLKGGNIKEVGNTRSNASICPVGNYTPKPKELCNSLQGESLICDDCDHMSPMGEKVIDVESVFGRETLLKKTQIGKVLFGDLFKFGFVVFRSRIPKSTVMNEVQHQINSSAGAQVGNQPKRRMLYSYGTNDGSSSKKVGKPDLVRIFQDKVFDKITSKVLTSAAFRMLKPNVIWNDGLIESDQLPHYDYPHPQSEQK